MINKSNSLKGKSIGELKEIEQAIKTILERSGETADDFHICPGAISGKDFPLLKDYESTKKFKYLVDLYVHDKDAFDYMMNSDTLFEGFFNTTSKKYVDYDELMRTLDANSLKTMEKITATDPIVDKYTSDSDIFYRDPENVKELHNLIAQHKTPADITAYRGERSVGMFKDMPLDETLSEELKSECIKAADVTKEVQMEVPNYDLNYHLSKGKEISLYDFICKKERLTLSDAMELCKYFDDETVDKIMAQISKTTITDKRFKSYSLSKHFAESWSNDGGAYNQEGAKMVIISKIKAGTEAIYADDLSAPNGQFEILLNDNPKTINFSNLRFDRDTNTFYVSSDIEPYNPV